MANLDLVCAQSSRLCCPYSVDRISITHRFLHLSPLAWLLITGSRLLLCSSRKPALLRRVKLLVRRAQIDRSTCLSCHHFEVVFKARPIISKRSMPLRLVFHLGLTTWLEKFPLGPRRNFSSSHLITVSEEVSLGVICFQ